MGLEYRTRDVGVFREVVGRLLRPHDRPRGRVTARADGYDARLRQDRIGALALTTLEYGNSVGITIEPPVDSYILHVPLAGALRARSRGPAREYGPRVAHIMVPDARHVMEWNARCRVLVLRVARSLVTTHARTLLGREPGDLSEMLPLTTPGGATLRRWLDFLRAEAADPASLVPSAGARQAEQMFFTLLLSAVAPGDTPARPNGAAGYVKRAEEFIAARLDEDIGLIDIVAASGVSVRTLYYGFRRRRAMAPMAWLRQLRLERAHAELAAPDPTTTVTAVALRWRLSHLGRFARSYEERFGEPPSATLRRSR